MARRKKPTLPQPPRKALRFLDPHHPRLLAVLRWLEGRGGTAQVRFDVVAEECGVHRRSLSRMLRWLELYGAIHVDRNTGADFGTGRNPSRYTQLMSVADYERDAKDIVEAIRASLRSRTAPKGGFPRGTPAIDPEEMARITEQARQEVLASIETLGKLPPLDAEPLSTDEAVAWATAFPD